MAHQPSRFFAEDLSSETVRLPREEAHHALRVLRLGVGAELELFDGYGNVADGRIVEVTRQAVDVGIEARRSLGPRPLPVVHVAFAVPKGKRLDWLLEKATELGAASLRPVVFQRSVAGALAGRLAPAKRRRWTAHCVAAAKQSGLNWLPEIGDPMPLAEFLTQELFGAEGYFGVMGVAEGAPGVRQVLARAPAGRDVCLLVGPEGGLTHAELAGAAEAGFVPARLGRTVLRVETAAVALLAAVVAIHEADGPPIGTG